MKKKLLNLILILVGLVLVLVSPSILVCLKNYLIQFGAIPSSFSDDIDYFQSTISVLSLSISTFLSVMAYRISKQIASIQLNREKEEISLAANRMHFNILVNIRYLIGIKKKVSKILPLHMHNSIVEDIYRISNCISKETRGHLLEYYNDILLFNLNVDNNINADKYCEKMIEKMVDDIDKCFSNMHEKGGYREEIKKMLMEIEEIM